MWHTHNLSLLHAMFLFLLQSENFYTILQVSEIEASKCDSKSMGSTLAQSNPPSSNAENTVNISSSPAPTYSTLSLASVPPVTLPMSLNSCSSLASEEGRMVMADSCLRTKAESTSVLMDGADSRRCEFRGSQQHVNGCRFKSKEGLCGQSWLGSKRTGKNCDKEHGSQPVNLSDISEMKGMPCHHATGCDNLLAVLDATSSEHVFMDKGRPRRIRCTSASSSSSSIEACSVRKCSSSSDGVPQCCESLSKHFHYSDLELDRAAMQDESVFSGNDMRCNIHSLRSSCQRSRENENERCMAHGSRVSKLSICSPISEDNICDDGEEVDEEERNVHPAIVVKSATTITLKDDTQRSVAAFIRLGSNSVSEDSSYCLPEIEVPSGKIQSCSELPHMIDEQKFSSELYELDRDSPCYMVNSLVNSNLHRPDNAGDALLTLSATDQKSDSSSIQSVASSSQLLQKDKEGLEICPAVKFIKPEKEDISKLC